MKRLQYWLIALPSALAIIALLYALPTIKEKNKTASADQFQENTSSFSIMELEKQTSAKLDQQQKDRLQQFYKDSTNHPEVYSLLSSFWSNYSEDRNAILMSFYYNYLYHLTSTKVNSHQVLNKGRMMTLIAMETKEASTHNVLLDWAVDLFKKAKMQQTANDSILVDIASAQLWYVQQAGRTNNPMQAVAELKDILKKNPRQTYAMYILGMASLLSNQTDKAIEHFENILKVEPNSVAAFVGLENAYQKKGNDRQSKFWQEKRLKNTSKKK